MTSQEPRPAASLDGLRAEIEKRLARCIHLVQAGVIIVDPATTYVGDDVSVGEGTVIQPNTTLSGRTVIGRRCTIGPNAVIADSTVADDCTVVASFVENAVLEEAADVGPFSHLRPGAHIGRNAHIGNFVEVKASRLGAGTKAGHFSYIGDAEVGADVNIGAGTITCNFDGEKKNRTVIGDNVFIGSDTMLVAPLTIGRGSSTGAGSVVTRDVPDGTLVAGVPARPVPRIRARKQVRKPLG